MGNEARVTGSWLFAGILLLIAGVLNIIWGLGAIGDAKFFIANQNNIIGSLHTWGWVTLISRCSGASSRASRSANSTTAAW